MDFLFVSTLILAFVLSMLVSGNNLSAAVGTLVGSRIVSRQGGILIGAIGFASGYLLQGDLMSHSASQLLHGNGHLVVILFLVSIFIFLVAQILKAPLSLTLSIVGTAVGISLRNGFPIDVSYLWLLVIAWVASPVIAIVAGYAFGRMSSRIRMDKTWNVTVVLKLLLLVISFLTAYTLGANTIGLLGAFAGNRISIIIAVLAGIAAGSVFLSKGILKRIGEDMFSMRYLSALTSLVVSSLMVEIATLFSIPLSNTQTLTSAVFGQGLSFRVKAMYSRPFLLVVLTWIIAPLVGLGLGFLA